MQIVLPDRLAEADLVLGNEHLDGGELCDGLGGSLRLVIAAAREISGDAAGNERDGKDDDTCGVHTRYCLLSRRGAMSPTAASHPVPTTRVKRQRYMGACVAERGRGNSSPW